MARSTCRKIQKRSCRHTRKHICFSAVRFPVALCGMIAVMVFFVFPLISDELPAANAVAFQTDEYAFTEDIHTVSPVQLKLENMTTYTPAPTFESTPSPTCGVMISQYALLQMGDQFPAVQNLQARFIELGYLEADEPSDEYNAAIAGAVSLFQRSHSYEVDGVADSDLQETLFSDSALGYEAKLGDSGADVRGMQLVLTSLGYYDGKTNGYFGVATEAALQSFQIKNALSQDNIFNVDDRDVLYSERARPLIDPTPTPKPVATPKPTRKPQPTKPPSDTTQVAPDEPTSEADKTPAPPAATPSESNGFHASGDVDGIISVAEAQIGKGYALGDEGPNTFDCSGLVYYCLSQNGVSIGRYSSASYANVDKWTRVDSMSDLQRGDLLFFRDDKSAKVSHVAIYIGGGKMIDASSNRSEVVKRSCTTDYWRTNFICARRIWG